MEASISSLVSPRSHSKSLSEIRTSSDPWTPSPGCPLPPRWRIILCFLSPLLQEVLLVTFFLFPSLLCLLLSLTVVCCLLRLAYPCVHHPARQSWHSVLTLHNTSPCVRIGCLWEGVDAAKRTEHTEPHSFIRTQDHQCDLCPCLFHPLYTFALNCT